MLKRAQFTGQFVAISFSGSLELKLNYALNAQSVGRIAAAASVFLPGFCRTFTATLAMTLVATGKLAVALSRVFLPARNDNLTANLETRREMGLTE
jgi:hypothetical protein